MLAPSDIRLQPGDALLIVDVQNDILPGGSLAVRSGDEVVAPLNHWIVRFTAAKLAVFATRDWHPPGHCSFRAQGGLWPPHCVADTRGAEFPAALALRPAAQRHLGYAVLPLTEAVRAVDLHPGDGERAIAAMVAGGAVVVGNSPDAYSWSPPSAGARAPLART